MMRLLKAVKKMAGIFLVIFCVYLITLFFREQRLSAGATAWICDKLSTSNCVVSCGSAAFGFTRGISLHEFKLYDLTREYAAESAFSADLVAFSWLRRRIMVVDPVFKRLGDAYYRPGIMEAPPPMGIVAIPVFAEYQLEVEGGNILGVCPKRLTAAVSSDGARLDFTQLTVEWMDLDEHRKLKGACSLDLREGKITGAIEGFARKEYIRPMLERSTLDIAVAVEYIDAFDNIKSPVPARCAWEVDLNSLEFSIGLKLSTDAGRFRSVPFKHAESDISVQVYYRDGFKNYEVAVGPVAVTGAQGEMLNGTVVFSGTNGIEQVAFDAVSLCNKRDLLNIVDYLNDGTLDCLEFSRPSEVSVRGALFPAVAHQRLNKLNGSISFVEGSLFSLPLINASCRYSYIGSALKFSEAQASGRLGGRLWGSATLDFPGMDAERAAFSLELNCEDGRVREFVDALKLPMDDSRGKVEGRLALAGPIASNCVARLTGEGKIAITEANLAQLRLFHGLTDYFVHYFNQNVSLETIRTTNASGDFKISEGVIHSDNVIIEGTLFAIKASGGYDMVNDRLDFKGQVRLLNESNAFKQIANFLLSPITSLFTEFKVTGSVSDPKWQYQWPLKDTLKGAIDLMTKESR